MSWIKPISLCSPCSLGNWEGIYLTKWMYFCAWVRQYIKMLWFFCQTESKHWCYFQHAQHFISPRNLSIISIHSVCACRVRFMVLTIMSQKSVVFCEVHSNEPFPTVFKFFSDLALGNAPRIALNTSHLEWGLLQVIETIINLIVSCNIAVRKRGGGGWLQQLNLLLFPNQLDLWNPFLFACLLLFAIITTSTPNRHDKHPLI